ncbi:FHA domain-containing protein [uncultured Porphyromonas sp.]|uniref:FHA domain-containing protein n=1 Tax=uncultured Porphyromonas sp. TaxID=159274 RepID=UPI00261A63F2|nr:FHA domain-containing protein [uncultured Porphyromonas sp.]
MSTVITCPYCGTSLEVTSNHHHQDSAERVVCEKCKQPFALYRTAAEALQHRDRRIKAVSIEGSCFSEDATYLEIIETEFTKPQTIQIPEGKSLFGRYNPRSSAQLQVLTADPSIDRQHAYFQLDRNGHLDVLDNDSMTGTFVNGAEIAQGEHRRLSNGDVLTFGATTAIVHLPHEEGDEGDEWLDF